MSIFQIPPFFSVQSQLRILKRSLNTSSCMVFELEDTYVEDCCFKIIGILSLVENRVHWSIWLGERELIVPFWFYSWLVAEITCFTVTLSTIVTFPLSKSYFSPFHLAVVSDGDSNMRFFRKFSLRRHLIILKCLFLSRQFEIIECFNSSILVILHSLFASFSSLFDLDDDISLIYEIRIFRKLEKLLNNDVTVLCRMWGSGLVTHL
jgi:hypothetical protein